jgi:putative transposase
MQTCHLVSTQPGKPKFRVAQAEAAAVPNQLDRAFQPTAPNRVWCGDITYVQVAGQWAYLAVVLDLYARRVVGWQVSDTPDTTLVLQALRRAVETRQPAKGLLFHSDQGVQYRSLGYQRYLRHQQISPSMSRKGNCWDNAPMERLFRSLKTEWMPRRGYHSLQETRKDVGEYLMGYYNRERVHSYNGYVTPERQESQYQPPNGVSKNT